MATASFPPKLISAKAFCTAALLFTAIAARAQTTSVRSAASSASASTSSPSDPLGLGRETPRGTVIGFVRAAQNEDDDEAIQYFDPRRRSAPAQEKELAAQLLSILNARFAGSLDSISDVPQ